MWLFYKHRGAPAAEYDHYNIKKPLCYIQIVTLAKLFVVIDKSTYVYLNKYKRNSQFKKDVGISVKAEMESWKATVDESLLLQIKKKCFTNLYFRNVGISNSEILTKNLFNIFTNLLSVNKWITDAIRRLETSFMICMNSSNNCAKNKLSWFISISV